MLALAITVHLYPRVDPEREAVGRLTKVRAQAVSRRSCAGVAIRLGLPARLRAVAPSGTGAKLADTLSVQAEALEAVIGACFLHYGPEPTTAAVVEAFEPEIEAALVRVVDFKSLLQERLARRGEVVAYDVIAELGPPHERTFEVTARVAEREVGRGEGQSKKDAEQAAARAALEVMGPSKG